MRRLEKTTVLAVGQTPPPYGGQAVMIERMLRGRYRRMEVISVRLAFSRDMSEVGKFKVSKLLHLVDVILKIYLSRVRYCPQILYYCPGGPERIPFYRDVVLLTATRWLFRATVFHLHAGGLSELINRLSAFERFLFKLAYNRPDVVIRLSEFSPPDDAALNARTSVILPNGIPDAFSNSTSTPPSDLSSQEADGDAARGSGPPRILFVGVVRESKGILVLLDACDLLLERGVAFALEVMGSFQSADFERQIRRRLAGNPLEPRVRFLGVLTGPEKWQVFNQADLLCFPSFFESESQPLAIIEAMQFSLPVVATRWRGIPSLVETGFNGELVPIREPAALADALEGYLTHPELRRRAGRMGRQRYLERHAEARWQEALEEAVLSACSGRDGRSNSNRCRGDAG